MSAPQAALDRIAGMVAENRTSVLVAGGGMVGLSMAAFLSWHGVRCLLVERQPALTPHPRARGVNPRTMELLRALGLEERVRDTASSKALARNAGVIAVETLAGRQVGELRQYFMDHVTDLGELSPTGWCMCYQDELEPLLYERASELGAELLLDTELLSAEADDTGVTAVLRDRGRGAGRTVRADYLVAADGAGSETRARLGIGTHGPGSLGHFMNVAFEADLTEPLGSRRFIMCYVTGTGTRCALLPVNNRDRWMLHVMYRPGEEASFTERRCVELVRAAAGVPGLDVRVESVLPWHSAGLVADRFQDGRVFLAGDAAHVMPPTGAFGSNTGVQDAHNLAWKLAAVLRGEASPSLLATYDAERRPVADLTVAQAVLRHADRPRMAGQAPAAPDPAILPDEQVIFDYRYPAPAGGGDGREAGPGAPGTRAPHVPLVVGGAERSTLDLYARRPVLVAGPEGEAWRGAAARAAAGMGVPLDVHVLAATPDAPGPYDAHKSWCERHGVTPSGAVLVRPDGFVAWRAAAEPADPGAAVGDALAALLRPGLTEDAAGGPRLRPPTGSVTP
ncbi:FAD-dependent monooxygenase [Sphaerisporangium sp. TRM90804]|uniref:FAD-dependent monooxygenase n=1 Tax=Sphaerisporangium sp. TRM90804 TaxID=3031113 RepID=UPI002447A2D6|nr:FAD-dependent monooxygenase [Sphaerisporangium sp. TRM90804]MDH2427220.1 FAD-dependent monooxygenase [Sphaerisporangium sp. TRM90804]